MSIDVIGSYQPALPPPTPEGTITLTMPAEHARKLYELLIGAEEAETSILYTPLDQISVALRAAFRQGNLKILKIDTECCCGGSSSPARWTRFYKGVG